MVIERQRLFTFYKSDNPTHQYQLLAETIDEARSKFVELMQATDSSFQLSDVDGYMCIELGRSSARAGV